MIFRTVVLATCVMCLSLYARHGEAPAMPRQPSLAAACPATGCEAVRRGPLPALVQGEPLFPPLPVVVERLRSIRAEIEREQKAQPRPEDLAHGHTRLASQGVVD